MACLDDEDPLDEELFLEDEEEIHELEIDKDGRIRRPVVDPEDDETVYEDD